MVCIPCIVAPVLLFIWYRFIQPVVLKIWNPWAPKKYVKSSSDAPQGTESEIKSSCPLSKKSEIADDQCTKEALYKKSD